MNHYDEIHPLFDFDDEPTTEYPTGTEPTTPLWPGTDKIAELRDAHREWLGRAEERTVLL